MHRLLRRLAFFRDLNVLFISHCRAESNSGYHVQHYANLAAAQGISVAASFTRLADDSGCDQSGSFLTHRELATKGVEFRNDRGPDIVHAWTPREVVRKLCCNLATRFRFKTVVHFEDNEEYLTENATGRSISELMKFSSDVLDELIPRSRYHPKRGAEWLERVDGTTLISDSLGRFQRDGLPLQILPAPVDERLFYPRPDNLKLRGELGIPDGHLVVTYTGNLRPLKAMEATELYAALVRLNEEGTPTVLIRTGEDYIDIGVDESEYTAFERRLGWVERERIPEVLAAADILIQPGSRGPFDDERVPAKLPEYFAMGRPVVLPAANLGKRVRHGEEAFVVDSADCEGIVRAVKEIAGNEILAKRLAEGARKFFVEQLKPEMDAVDLAGFYREVLRNGVVAE